MANQTSLTGYVPGTLLVTTSALTLTLDQNRAYLVYHTNLTSALAASNVPVFIACGEGTADAPTVDADGSENTNKVILSSNIGSILIGPGIGQIKAATASGEATVVVIPQQSEGKLY